jgi:ATP-dependent exoDNAse (exonuclease V) beta subunit
MNTSSYFDPENLLFEVGLDYRPARKDQPQLVKEMAADSLVSISFDKRLKLRMSNKYYFSKDGLREFGSLMHDIISRVEGASDLQTVLDAYTISGDISATERKGIETEITAFFGLDVVKEWYSGNSKVLNEVDILLPDGTFVRPDRVMISGEKVTVIDYKFGEKEESKYEKQVSRYVQLIRQIGHENVVGYVCYVKLGKVIKIAS